MCVMYCSMVPWRDIIYGISTAAHWRPISKTSAPRNYVNIYISKHKEDKLVKLTIAKPAHACLIRYVNYTGRLNVCYVL
jgi:hypothetical protein